MTNVVFDVGNVLIHWDPRVVMRRHFQTELEIETFFNTVNFFAWNLTLDRGRNWNEAVETLSSSFPQYKTAISSFRDDWHDCVTGEISSSVESLEKLLEAGVPLYAITNFSLPRWRETQIRFSFLRNSFRDVVVSGEVEMVKPDPEIFHHFLDRNDLKAEDCVFIDDSAANIETARILGFDAIHFNEDIDLRLQMAERGVLA